MGFLRTFDYYSVIQPTILQRLLQAAINAGFNANLVQEEAEDTAQEEISEILRQHFDITSAFNPTLVWGPTQNYNANQLVELNFPAWKAQAYTVGQLVSFSDGNAYLCVIAASSGQVPAAVPNWIKIGQQNALYYLPFPYPLFQLQSGLYSIGSKTFWKGNNYSAQTATQIIDQITRLNAVKISRVPFPNVFPDNSQQGVQAWGTGVPYSLTGGTLPSYTLWSNVTTYVVGNTIWYNNQVWTSLANGNLNNIPGADMVNWTLLPLSILIPLYVNPIWSGTYTYGIGQIISYNNQLWQSLVAGNVNNTPGTDIINWQPVGWTAGDNRTKTLVKYMCDIALYHLHAAISPDNIPDLRGKRYDAAILWINNVKNISSSIPLLQPDQGGPILWGGNTKRNNTW